MRRRNTATEILNGIGDLAGESEWGIDIEITEGALFGDSSSCVHALRLLRAAGVRVAIDDFGTGFSSLGRLSELPIDTLKIDRMFTSRLPADRKSCTLVSTIIGLAHAFDMTTVAEGVENQAQLDYLIREGCDESQGYLHSRPLPRADLERLLSVASPVGVTDEKHRAGRLRTGGDGTRALICVLSCDARLGRNLSAPRARHESRSRWRARSLQA
jgi:EAL domain-containing protein (putative c-di-GMP-specific phosphodiesterase class I)